MMYLYVLECEGGNWYIGTTHDMDKRFKQHSAGKGGAKWTKAHKPVRVHAIYPLKSKHDEDNLTKDYMWQHGYDKVRGGSYCEIDLTPEQYMYLERERCTHKNLCHNCKSDKHFVNNCPLPPISIDDYDKDYTETDSETEEEEGFECDACGDVYSDYYDAIECAKGCSKDALCARCGRRGHAEGNCFATLHKSGYVLDSDDEE
jgi:hypothetical protein